MHIPTFLDQKFRWLSVPGLIRAIASLQAVFFVVLIFNQDAAQMISPDWELIREGQIWRIFSFILYPPVFPSGGSLVFSVFWLLLSVWVAFLISDVLEGAWGETLTSLYVFSIIFCQGLLIHLISYGLSDVSSMAGLGSLAGTGYHTALFFAFATIAPHYVFHIMLILPVKVWILAVIMGVLILLQCLSAPILFIVFGAIYFPYLIWAAPLLIRTIRTRKLVHKRRNKFAASQAGADYSLHRCETCGKTEVTAPEAEFRVASDGEEYCLDHLP
ncbi:hypothetical protein N9139_00490 [Akkermansiaceae bacterium]|nr:hypothetical protein [Akkermansiaceae bacterium]MDB4507998.1 hypothetical protein [Akkermansiaceae bacterium]